MAIQARLRFARPYAVYAPFGYYAVTVQSSFWHLELIMHTHLPRLDSIQDWWWYASYTLGTLNLKWTVFLPDG